MAYAASPVFEPVRQTIHRYGDDLLTAGLGLSGLREPHPPILTNPTDPAPTELRRRAIYNNWRAIVDLSPSGAFGIVYGGAPAIPGREYHAFAHLPGASAPHRVLVQAPDNFDRGKRCLLVTASPGSRGIYGGIGLAGAWGLPLGCAVAYTDKGAGTGYFDTATDTGVSLDGTRARRSGDVLEFALSPGSNGIGIKHAHSKDNPEAHWGDCILQAVDFGLAMLDRAYPDAAPFTRGNTRVIAVGLSNGGAAVLQAAGRDYGEVLDGVVAISPNVHVAERGRPLYDYASEASLLFSSALAAPAFQRILEGRFGEHVPYDFTAQGDALRAAGLLDANKPQRWPEEALERLVAAGWETGALQAAAAINELELWRAAGATYASAYLRRPPEQMPCALAFEAFATTGDGHRREADEALRAAWWSDASGIPPGAGVALAYNGRDMIEDFLCLRTLWTGTHPDALLLRDSVSRTAVSLPRQALPIWIAHGRDDGLIPARFSSDAYVAWLQAADREPVYWEVPAAQHFDALLGWPELGKRYLPMMPYAYVALDGMLQHLCKGSPLPRSRVLDSQVRGDTGLEYRHLGVPEREVPL